MDRLIEKARNSNSKVDGKELRKHLVFNPFSHLLNNGRHILSAGDVISKAHLLYLFETQMMGIDDDDDDDDDDFHVLFKTDDYGSTGLHYAAEYEIEEVFKSVINYDHHHHHHHHHKRLKAICKSIRYEDHQSICSLLIAKDRDDLLHKYMIRILKINPFETEFKDVHFDWFHEALFCGATKVVFYLFHYHREMLENVVFHAPNKDNNKRREIFSYFDLVLMSPHLTMSQRQIYFDEILCRVPYGLKLFHHTPKDIVKFCSLQLVKFVTANMSPIDFVRRCIQDNMK